MMLDIFSTFDDHNKNTFSLFWMSWGVMFLIMVFSLKIKTLYSPSSAPKLMSTKISHDLVSQTKTFNLGGALSGISSVMITLIMLNFFGLTPFIFSVTSHLAINLSLSLPLWIAIIFMGSSFNIKSFISHFLPAGAPWTLVPLLIMIELVSNLIRPLTLAVRLTANLSTGHILLGLLGSALSSLSFIPTSITVTILGIFYIIFELAVCVIQAYIFSMLPTLYADEHPNN